MSERDVCDLADRVYWLVFHLLDADPGLTGDEAGRAAALAERAVATSLRADCELVELVAAGE